MKKIVAILFAVMSLSVFADTWTDPNTGITWTYIINNGKASVGSGWLLPTVAPKSTTGAITIPSTLGGCPVTSIGGYAFYGCSGLTSVTIPVNVTSIGGHAFSGCSGLTSVTIPNSVTSIGYSAFYGCSGLTSITIPSSVTSIEDSAFSGCSGLTSITIPSSVTSIGGYAFRYCSGLTSITIPSSVTSIGYSAFSGCSGLASVAIPSSVKCIGDRAFEDCSGLTSITIPSSVTSIDSEAFSGCSGLTEFVVDSLNKNYSSINGLLCSKDGKTLLFGINGNVVIPEGVTSIGYQAFYGRSGLTSITIPSSVTSIGDYAFRYCSGLTLVTIAEGGKSIIGNYAFSGCSGLTSVTIPSSVTSIGWYAFDGCSGLTSVTILEGVTSIGDYAFQDCGSLATVTICEGVTSIGGGAFYNCSGLKSVTIPSSVTSIGDWAFRGCSGLTSISVDSRNEYYCSIDGVLYNKDVTELICCPGGLTSVTIPSSVTSIGWYAFDGCSGLTSITIPSSVTSIGREAFYNCSGLTSVTIPSSVTSIGDWAFYGCNKLKTIYVHSGDVSRVQGLMMGKDIDVEALKFLEVMVPDGGPYTQVVDGIEWTYMVSNGEASVGGGSSSSTAVPKSTTGAITIPSTLGGCPVTSIGRRAFYGCSGLTSVTIPEGVTSIGLLAFSGCSGLKEFHISDIAAWCKISFGSTDDNPLSYAHRLYLGNKEVTNLTIPEGVTSIGDLAFYGCSGIKSVTIPSSVTSIGSSAFSDCSGLMEFIVNPLNKNYSSINGLLCFKDGKTLLLGINGDVTIPSSVTSIGDSAFYGRRGLTSVTIPSSVTSIGDYAFYKCSKLTSVTIPSSVTSIGNDAFSGCSGLTSITIPEGVTSIGSYAFHGCSGLASITIPSSVTSIGICAFESCSRLTSITIPEGVTSIGEGAFEYCIGLTSVTIPSSVTSIGKRVFADTKLMNDCDDGLVIISDCLITYKGISPELIAIPNNIRVVADGAFGECDILNAIDFEGKPPIGVDDVGIKQDTAIRYNVAYREEWEGVAAQCGWTNAKAYAPVAGGPYTEIVDGIKWTFLVDKDFEASISGASIDGEKVSGDISIPPMLACCPVTSIKESLFEGCDNLTSIAIPSSVTSIGYGAFRGCSELKSFIVDEGNSSFSSPNGLLCSKDGKTLLYGVSGEVVIPNCVTSINSYAFYGYSGLTSIIIPSSVNSIGSYAFGGCSNLTEVMIPACITKLSNTFPNAYDKIVRVVMSDDITSVANGAFTGCYSLQHLVFSSTIDVSREKLRKWGLVNATIETILSDYITDDYIVVNNTLLGYVGNKDAAELLIPEGVAFIDDEVFAMFFYLEQVKLPVSLKRIGNGAFSNCTEMVSIDFTEELKSVGVAAFMNCISLERVVLNNGLESLGESAFAASIGSMRLKSVSLPVSLTKIGDGAFDNCDYITGVTVPTHLKTMKDLFPDSYAQIESVVIPEGETTIIDNMFKGCAALKTVAIPNTITTIGNSAFENCVELEELGLPDNVTTLGAKAFYGCTKLRTVALPRSLEVIKDETFGKCPKLDSLVVPASVQSLGQRIYSGGLYEGQETYSLTGVRFLGNAPTVKSNSYEGMPSELVSYVVKGSTGWYTAGAPTLPTDGWPLIGNARDITYWTPNIFEVTFDGNGGTPETYVAEQITDTTYSLPKENPTRTGYLFEGWWTEPKAGAQIYWNTRVTATKAHTLYAHWKLLADGVTVVFNPNGGTVDPAEADYPAGVTYGNLPVPTRIGHEFLGWYTSPTGGDLITEATEVHKENDELYAHWRPITYLVVFDANGGSGTMADQTHTYNVTQSLSKNQYYLNGFKFTGWAETRGGKVKYGDQASVENLAEVQDRRITLYAVWGGASYAVRFDGNGGTGSMDNQTFVVGTSQSLTQCGFTRIGYAFAGWATNPDGIVVYKDKEDVKNLTMTSGATVSLYAVWSPIQYFIEYNANGGVGAMKRVACLYDSEVEIAANEFTRSGYEFEGWATSADGSVIYCPGEPVLNLSSASGDIVPLYAVWRFAEIATPVFKPLDGTVFADVCEVSITCATEGAAIYYRIGAKPKATDKFCYTKPFEIAETSEIWAFAQLGDRSSEAVCATLTKGDVLTIATAVDAVGVDSFETDDQTGWKPVECDFAKVGATCARSGEIGDDQSSCLVAKVNGAGVLTFQWKSSCEEDVLKEFDHTEFIVDGVEVARIDGITDWKQVSVELADIGTPHTVEWVYVKDESECDGEDCVWIDEVVWEPKMAGGAVIADVTALKEAFGEGSSVVRNLTSEEELVKFNEFLGKCGIATASQISDKQKQYAYESFRMSAITVEPRLFENEPKLKIHEFKQGEGGWSVSISLKAGGEEIAMARKELEEHISVGNKLTEITAKPDIVASPSADGSSLTFTIAPPEGKQAFIMVRL